MKKLILGLIASASIMTANAQAGSWLLYGNVGLSSTSSGLASTTWTLTPGIGYQFNDNWTVGINLSWSQTPTNRDTANNLVVMNDYWGGPFVRYTHTISNLFYCYTQLDLSYMGTYRTPGDHPADMKGTGFGAAITPALGINVGKGYGLNVSLGGLGYSSMSYTTGSTTDTKFNLSFGQALMIGLSKNFGGHMHKGSMEPGSDLRGVKDTKDDDDK